MKMKNFDPSRKQKCKHGRKFSQNISDKNLEPRIYKEFLKCNNEKTTPFLKQRKDFDSNSQEMIYKCPTKIGKDIQHH